ncbi:MAG TPA: hypothetical protein VK487_04825, partial [Candidatus Bathyarchaeia archaeon]|nr:hypothetical protein [Candidatus Bathyarchaeia archaeon]
MSQKTAKRDKEISDLVIKTYQSQYDLREKLDNKLNNFVVITATIATLSIGIALFVFGKVTVSNPYYYYLVESFLTFLILFTAAIIVGLYGYKPTKYSWYPEDSERLIMD